jgi:hypothetical protein
MSKHGVGPTDDDRERSGRYEEQLAFPQSTASDDLSGALKRLKELDTLDRRGRSVSLERIALGLRALNEAEDQYRVAQSLDRKGLEDLQTLLEALCDTSQKILADLRARRKDVPADRAQLAAVLGDKLSSIWAQYFVATDAEPEVLSIAKNLYAIFDLGKLQNIDDLPQHIKDASHLSPLALFGLWGVSESYFGMMKEVTGLAQHDAKVLICSLNQALAARQLAEAPPHELALLKGVSHTNKAQDAFRIASELLIKSVLTTTAEARDQGIILRAQRASELVVPFIQRLDVSQLRSWMTDYSMTCRQAQDLKEFEFARRMWDRLEELAHSVGDSVAVEALRFRARRIKSDMSLDDLVGVRKSVDYFRTRFEKLQPEKRQELSSEAMTVGQAAISLLLREVQGSAFYQHAQDLLSDACKEVDALASLAQVDPSIGSFMVVESTLEVASTYLERNDIDQSHERALELWQRASTIVDEADKHCTDGTLYSRITCRIFLAEVGALFDDRGIQASQREALEKLWDPLVATLEAKDLKDYERFSYEFAQINLLRTLAAVDCWLDEEGSGGGVNAIVRALSLYERYSVSDPELSLIRSLYDVAIRVHEKNHRYSEATQYRQKLERLGLSDP